ncbi:MAG: HU family DNA-binding protein [Planctomycetes bacterium]|jgi:nucleoid DNA-binding protein|nr:HU family DNA-binding protein [Planctomycetota bacterium]
MAKSAAKAPTQSEVLNNLATATGLTKKQIAAVFEALTNEIKKNVTKGSGVFKVPGGLLKVTRKKVDAKPARKNVPDPFNPGQFRDYPAKPASSKIRVVALKTLKDMVKK